MFTIRYMTRPARMYTWVSYDPIDALAMERALITLNIPYRVYCQNQACELFNTKESYGR